MRRDRMHPADSRGCRGAAVISTLLAAALLSLIAALAAQQAVVSYLIGHRMREAAEATVAAETGLAGALGDLARQPSFARLEAAAGAGYPFADQAPPLQPLPSSFVVEVAVRRGNDQRLDVVATARGRNGARRSILATVERDTSPYVPAALFIAGAAPAMTTAGAFEIAGAGSGIDPVPALATPSPADARDLALQLEAAGAAPRGAVTATAWHDLDEILLRARDGAASLPEPLPEAVPHGLWVSDGPLAVTDASGAGVWLIDGDLTVEAALSFDGLLIVLGDILFADGSTVAVDGALVQAPPGHLIVSRGQTAIAYDAGAIAAADVSHPERPSLLGRRATVIGRREEDL